MTQPRLAVLELGQAPAHQVVGAAAAAAQVLGQLGEGPVLVQVEAAGLALAVGEQAAVDVEQTLEVGGPGEGGEAGGEAGGGAAATVKVKAWTVYPSPPRLRSRRLQHPGEEGVQVGLGVEDVEVVDPLAEARPA